MPSRAFRSFSMVCIALAATAMSAASASGQRADTIATHTNPSVDSSIWAPLTFTQKLSLYSSRTYSARALLASSYAAGLAQWRGTPKEWGAGISGYARRDAAAYGGGVVRHTAEFAFGAALHEDPRFERSMRSGIVARTEDAVRTSIVVRTDDGGHRIAWSRAVASLATGFAVNSWEPRRLHSTHHALMLSLAGALSYTTASVTQEFTPDVRRYVLRKLHVGGGD